MLVKWGSKLDEVDNEGNTAGKDRLDAIKSYSLLNVSAHLAAMEGHLPCLKFIVSVYREINTILGARNDQGDTPKSLAEQFFKEDCCTYLDALEWEQDHPEQAESKRRSPRQATTEEFFLCRSGLSRARGRLQR